MQNLLDQIERIKGVSFISLEYTNKQNETSKYLLNVGASYANAKSKDVKTLKALEGVFEGIKEKARVKLLESLLKPHKAKSEAQKNAYTVLNGGVKLHNETEKLLSLQKLCINTNTAEFLKRQTVEKYTIIELDIHKNVLEGGHNLETVSNNAAKRYLKVLKEAAFSLHKDSAKAFELSVNLEVAKYISRLLFQYTSQKTKDAFGHLGLYD